MLLTVSPWKVFACFDLCRLLFFCCCCFCVFVVVFLLLKLQPLYHSHIPVRGLQVFAKWYPPLIKLYVTQFSNDLIFKLSFVMVDHFLLKKQHIWVTACAPFVAMARRHFNKHADSGLPDARRNQECFHLPVACCCSPLNSTVSTTLTLSVLEYEWQMFGGSWI